MAQRHNFATLSPMTSISALKFSRSIFLSVPAYSSHCRNALYSVSASISGSAFALAISAKASLSAVSTALSRPGVRSPVR